MNLIGKEKNSTMFEVLIKKDNEQKALIGSYHKGKTISEAQKQAIKNKLYSVKKEKQYSKDKEYENIKDLWNYIDSLEAMDKKIVEHFIKNNNSPIYLYDNSYIKVLHELCNSSQIISDGTQKFFNIVDGKEEHYIDKGVHIYQFKLNEDAYNLLNYSLKKYKKISNFS